LLKFSVVEMLIASQVGQPLQDACILHNIGLPYLVSAEVPRCKLVSGDMAYMRTDDT
jgi:hypothetical protein